MYSTLHRLQLYESTVLKAMNLDLASGPPGQS